MSIKIRPQELAGELRKRFKAMPELVEKSLDRAAQRGRAHLVRKTPVDTGQMKNAWRTKGSSIVNDAPHAGIIEEGARPHKVSAEGMAAIEAWAMRKLGVTQEEASAVAWSLAKKLARQGQKGLFIVRDSMDDLRKFVVKEVVREIQKQANQRAR